MEVLTDQTDPNYTKMQINLANPKDVRINVEAGRGEVVGLDELPQGGNPGEPKLPYRLVRLLVPPDADLANIKADLVRGN